MKQLEQIYRICDTPSTACGSYVHDANQNIYETDTVHVWMKKVQTRKTSNEANIKRGKHQTRQTANEANSKNQTSKAANCKHDRRRTANIKGGKQQTSKEENSKHQRRKTANIKTTDLVSTHRSTMLLMETLTWVHIGVLCFWWKHWPSEYT